MVDENPTAPGLRMPIPGLNFFMSEKTDLLFGAISKLRAKMPHVEKNRVNPHFKNRYADLDQLLVTLNPLLAEHGLSAPQFPVSINGEIGVLTLVTHISGQHLGSVVHLKPGRPGPQEAGAILTYLKRYAFGAVLGISTDEDDDGNSATNQTAKPKAQPTTQRREVEQPATAESDTRPEIVYTGTPTQKKALAEMFKRHGIDSTADMKKMAAHLIEYKVAMGEIETYLTGGEM